MNITIEKKKDNNPVNNAVRVHQYVIQREINLHKVDIDRKAFTKTDEEREELKHAKKMYKKMQALTTA
jgi:hypothetical protein